MIAAAGAPIGETVICIVGPTAAGKSKAALALAVDRDIEIVSVDSAQVYRGMDVGTAKPSAADRARVVHHLIDIVEPSSAYSAASFCRDAWAADDDARQRGRLPVWVGGTMLYFKAVREGLDEMPEASPVTRAVIEDQARTRGWPTLHAELALVDPVSAARLAPNDAQRIQRALEVWRLLGKPISSLQQSGRQRRGGRLAQFVHISLEPSDRAALHQRIAARFDAMLSDGLVDEVRRLRDADGIDAAAPAMRCVGYRQVFAYLEGRSDARQLRETAIAATRQLAKRQLTWLRALPARIVIDCLAPDFVDQVRDAVARLDGAPG